MIEGDTMTQGSTTRKALLATAMAAGLLSGTAPAAAAPPDNAPVKIGVIDLKGDQLSFIDKQTTITYREFTNQGATAGEQKTKTGDDHGVIVASALVRQYRSLDSKTPIEIYSANPFQSSTDQSGKPVLRLDFKQAEKALEWMSENGVSVVVTAFNSPNAGASKRFMDKAEDLGLTIFASYSNVKVDYPIYPARDARAISVVDTNKADKSVSIDRINAAYAQNITFGMHGGVPDERDGYEVQTGSSFSSAKAGAYGAYVIARDPSATRDQIVAFMNEGTRPYKLRLGPESQIALLGEHATDKNFRSAVSAQQVSTRPIERLASKGPVKTMETPLLQRGYER